MSIRSVFGIVFSASVFLVGGADSTRAQQSCNAALDIVQGLVPRIGRSADRELDMGAMDTRLTGTQRTTACNLAAQRLRDATRMGQVLTRSACRQRQAASWQTLERFARDQREAALSVMRFQQCSTARAATSDEQTIPARNLSRAPDRDQERVTNRSAIQETTGSRATPRQAVVPPQSQTGNILTGTRALPLHDHNTNFGGAGRQGDTGRGN